MSARAAGPVFEPSESVHRSSLENHARGTLPHWACRRKLVLPLPPGPTLSLAARWPRDRLVRESDPDQCA
jgi:hypothetical protein